jgi:hypothetical protein
MALLILCLQQLLTSCGCEIWLLALRGLYRLKASKVRKRGSIFGPKWEQRENGEIYIMRSFIICTLPHIRGSSQGDEMGRACSTRGVNEKYVQNFN